MAIKINIENYEAYLLDYMEGNLSSEEKLLLQQFIVLHPELNIDLNELELVELSNEGVVFENKNELKKSVTALVSDEQFVNYIENTLTANEKHKIERLAATYPEVNKEFGLYKKTILAPDNSIVFENKSNLKKETKVIWLFSRQTLSIAAAILLVFGFWMLFKFYTPITSGIELSNNLTKATNSFSPTEKIPKQENKVAALKEELALSTSKKNDLVAAIAPNKIKQDKTTNTATLNAVAINTVASVITETTTVIINTNAAIFKENTAPAIKPNNIQRYIVTEAAFDEDEKTLVATNAKNGFWAKAKKALNGLNKLGVKAVNGTEASQSTSEQYVLSLGNFSVEKNKYNQE